MLTVVGRRVVGFVLTLLLASFVIFVVLDVLPGDTARQILGINASADAVAALRERMGLNDPFLVRYVDWLKGIAHGDLGPSLTYGVAVSDLILERAFVSVPLAVLALLVTVSIALPLGTVASARRGGRVDQAITTLAQLGIAVPNFWFAVLLVQLFAVSLRMLPSGGFPGWDDPGAALRSLLLPTVALALPQAAILTNIVRSSLVDVLSQPFIRTAHAKGVRYRSVLVRHALRNGLLPVLTIMGLQFAFLISGVIIIEQVFSLPGLGRLVFQAIVQNDLPVVRGVVVCLVAVVIAVNFAVDLLYALVDPRLRVAG